ncbi:MAG: right-handed parallel beta-helix repeat-containing protein, partial [Candidatus Thorarchaeota archaeon]|nr:right-handed parallel beta-helix repeat-containing protein [Candidatus Thorarchaeota archaeon]
MSRASVVLILCLALIICVSTTSLVTTIPIENQANANQEGSIDVSVFDLVNSPIHAYTPHDPIYINQNSDFIAEGFTGYGNFTHPYLLEGVEIEADGYGVAIDIQDTNASFVISNCSFDGYYSSSGGIYLVNVSNARVEDCFFQDTEFGLGYLESRNITVFNCTFKYHHSVGAWSGDSNNTAILNSTFRSCGDGIGVYSDNEVIIGNEFMLNDYGVSIDNSDNCTIVENEFMYDGIEVYGGILSNYIHNITDNTLNGKPIIYIHSQPRVTVSGDYGQVIVANCSNAIIEDERILIASYGLQVYFSDFVAISNVSTILADQGIVVSRSANVTIDSCNVTGGSMDGIVLEEADNATITNCRINDNSHSGIQIYSSDTVNITANTIANNGNFGISLVGINHTISNNYLGANGIHEMNLEQCENVLIESNTINGSLRSKVFIDGQDCIILDNTLYYSSFEFDRSSVDNFRHTISGNTINGHPIVYHFNETGILYDGVSLGQVIIVDSNTTTLQNLDFNNVSIPIILAFGQDFILDTLTFQNVTTGIQVEDCYNVSIDHSEFQTWLPYSFDAIGIDMD